MKSHISLEFWFCSIQWCCNLCVLSEIYCITSYLLSITENKMKIDKIFDIFMYFFQDLNEIARYIHNAHGVGETGTLFPASNYYDWIAGLDEST